LKEELPMTEKMVVPYEAPTVTLYGDIASLTQSVPTATGSDALCTGFGIPVSGVPSNVVCKLVGTAG
jgi:hypothetical protein